MKIPTEPEFAKFQRLIMAKKQLFVFGLAVLVISACRGESTNRLNFHAAGFSIAPLEAPAGQMPQQALMMFLPVTDGFCGQRQRPDSTVAPAQ